MALRWSEWGRAALRWMWATLWGSAPRLRGGVEVRGLLADVTVERDRFGVPTVTAGDRRDASFALGFAHAQERLFQMDLCRRGGAGRLAELLGADALALDRAIRPHRLERVADRALAQLPDAHRGVLAAYASGVNAGIGAARRRPFEYVLLRSRPQPWCERDSLLVVLCYYLLVQDGDAGQAFHTHLLYDALPNPLADFVAARGTPAWDAPLDGSALSEAELPDATVFSARAIAASTTWTTDEARRSRGSNGWAVSGASTDHGGALVANDMHLGFGVPTTFYRACLRYRDGAGVARRVTGVTVPGLPLVLAGSNGAIAWGLTNSAAQWVDLVRLDQDGLPEDRYRTAGGIEAVSTTVETLAIRGRDEEPLAVEETSFGPIVRTDGTGARFAQQWVAHFERSVNLELLHLETADTAAQALDIATASGLPAQNFVAGDRQGHIGWTIAGPIPRRRGAPSALPVRSSARDAGWSGWLARHEYPRVYDPPEGRLWTANARVVGGDELAKLGFGYYLIGARATMIRDRLRVIPADERAMYALQLDDRAVFLERWRALMLTALSPVAIAADRHRARARARVVDWSGRAARDCAGYRLVREFRARVDQLVFGPIIAAVRDRHPEFELDEVGDQREAPLWTLVTRRPRHLLPAPFDDWDELLLAAVDWVLREAIATSRRLHDHTWGTHNRLQMRHLFSGAVPGVRWWLDPPAVPLDGDLTTPLGQLAGHGPVMRMVVAPGQEQAGILQMPGGQTAHPSAPYFRAGHREWLRGTPTPFLPGPARYRLELRACAS